MLSKRLLRRLGNISYIFSAAFLIASLVMNALPAPKVAAATGAIWTTSITCASPAPQDQNLYNVDDTVHIRGSNLDVSTLYYWRIVAVNEPGKPVIASGSDYTDATGYFCVSAHTITQGEAGATYSVDVADNPNFTNAKNDNYRVAPYTPPPSPSMTVVKSSTTTSLSAPGTVTYSYVVTNTGDVPLTGISLSDNNDNNDMSCPSTTLAVGASMTCTATHTFTQTELDAGGTLDNTVTATSNEAPSASDSLSIPIVQDSGMTVVKTSATTSLSAPETVTYNYRVTNTGNVTLTGISLSDNNDNDDMSCPGTTLAVGDYMDCTATHTFTQAELDAGGTLDNTVTASSNETSNANDSLSIPIDQNPGMSIVKSSTTSSLASAPVTVNYSYVVTNTGNVTLTGISLTDNNDNNDLSCPSTTLAAGADMTCTATHTFTQAELDAHGSPVAGSGFLYNQVTASSNEAPDATDNLNIPITNGPVLTVVKSSTTTSLSAPGTVTYSYEVTNVGNVTVTGISLSDNNDNDDMSCPSTTLAVAASMTCTATHTFTQAELDAGGTLDNTVTATSNEAPDVSDSLSIPIVQDSGMTVEKSADQTLLTAPLTVNYSYLVTNTGNVTLTGISLLDDNASAVSCPSSTLAVGASMTCTATHNFSQAELDAGGTLDNNVTASSNETPDASDSLSIPMTQSPAISVVKTADTDLITGLNQLVTYTFEVTNQGNISLTGITVDDPKCDTGTLTGPTGGNLIADLQPGETWTYTCTHEVTQSDLDAASGNLSNTVTASSNETDPVQDSLDIPIEQGPGIQVVKSSTTTLIYAPAEVVPYTFEVSNVGNITLTGITVTDPNCNADPVYVSGDTNSDQNLQTTEVWIYTCSHTVTDAEFIVGGVLHNTVEANSNEVGPDEDSLDIPLFDPLELTNACDQATGLITWTLENMNPFPVDYIWKWDAPDAPSNPGTIDANSTITITTPSQSGTIIVYSDTGVQELARSVAAPCPYKPLTLTAVCATDPTLRNGWIIGNENTYPVIYEINKLDLSSPIVGPDPIPGESSVTIETLISYGSPILLFSNGVQQASASAKTGCVSVPTEPPNNPVVTVVPVTPVNPPTGEGPVVLIPVTGVDMGSFGRQMPGSLASTGLGFLGLGLVLNGIARRREE
jgi:uncharacterized repeat protein (TIGR01451 family)